jgi:hypothetical protein
MLVTVSWPDNRTDDIDTYVEGATQLIFGGSPSLNATASGRPAAGPDFRFFAPRNFR